MFDAGAIEARLTVNTAQFDRDMDKAEARVKSFTDSTHKVKISAVFDNASLSKATKAFTDLDNQISRQAMSRLRSSPQGSVLGALTALFSPHPVTGAPSPSQAASQGLLGKIVQAPGGGGQAGPVGATAARVLGTSGGGQVSTTDRVSVLGAPTDNSIKTTDRVSVLGLPTSGGTITTTDKIRADLDTTQVRAKASQAGRDAADAADDALSSEARRRGSGWFSGLLSGLTGMVTSALGGAFGGGKSGGGGEGGSVLDSGVLGGVGPGILGISASTAGISSAVAAVVAMLPALTSIGGALGAIGGGFLILDKTNKQFAADVSSTGSTIEKVLGQAASVMAKPLEAAMSQFAGFFKSIGPQLSQVFGAAVPLINPLVKGIESLVSGLLPGLVQLIKSAGPAMQVFAQALGGLGSSLGQMFRQFSTAIGPSSQTLKGFLGIINALLPFLGQLAAGVASALGPAFLDFAQILTGLLPVIGKIGTILGSFAGAVFSDLGSAIGAVVALLKDLSPSIDALGTAFTQMFTVLENSGAFAALGNALEAVAPLIAQLVNALITGLAPAFPQIIEAAGQLSTILVTLLAAGLTTILEALIPVVAWVAKITAAFVNWLDQNHLLLPVLAAIVIALDPVTAAVIGLIAAVGLVASHWQEIWTNVKNWTDDAVQFIEGRWAALPAPLRAVLDVIGDQFKQAWDLIATVAKQVWDEISAASKVAWDAIAGILKADWDIIVGLFKVFADLLTGNWGAAGRAMETAGSQAWNAIKAAFGQIWNAIAALGTQTWNNMRTIAEQTWNNIKAELSSTWTAIETAARAAWNRMLSDVKTVFGSIVSFFTGVPGKILGAMKALGTDMSNFGKSIMNDLLSGIKSVWNGIASFFAGIPGDILHALGIHSPPGWAVEAGKWIMKALGIGMDKAQSAVTGATASVVSTVSGAAGSIQALMQQMAAARGWTGSQWAALNNVEMREAGYNPNATNPSSGAYGLAQFIDGPSEYAQYGGSSTTPAGQIAGMLSYIAQRYGNPEAAWQHELDYGWYDNGGLLRPGYTLAYNGTGQPERVTTAAQDALSGDQMERLISAVLLVRDTTAAVPAGVGMHVGGALGGAAADASFRSRYPRGGS